jgi:hypothetical protein
MDEKGVDRPSRSIRESKREPSGTTVKPGNYTLEMVYGDSKSTQTILVKSDPRLKVSEANINEVYNASKKIRRLYRNCSKCCKTIG